MSISHISENPFLIVISAPSGGGKSTLCNLIARFWDVDEGEVSLGGINVKDYNLKIKFIKRRS